MLLDRHTSLSHRYLILRASEALVLPTQDSKFWGLNLKSIQLYLENDDMISAQQAFAIQRFNNSDVKVLGMVRIPIVPEIVCFGWDELQRSEKTSAQEITMTTSYEKMIQKLWRKGILNLNKCKGGTVLTPDIVHDVSSLHCHGLTHLGCLHCLLSSWLGTHLECFLPLRDAHLYNFSLCTAFRLLSHI
jgi:hypothetical protein